MKKIICLLMAILFTASLFSGCSKVDEKVDEEVEEYAEEAIEMIKKEWENTYKEANKNSVNNTHFDEYVEIKNTRVIIFDDDNENEYFKDIECIVEFTLFTDYYGSNTYYSNCNMNDNVIFYKDGSKEISSHFIRQYFNTTYDLKLEGIDFEIYDLDDKYDQVLDLNL